jgi:alpha-galactosidase
VGFVDPASPFAINVNMDSTVQSGLEGPVGGLGAVWNTTGASASNLLLASGPASTVGFTSSGTGGWGGPNENDTEPALRMLKRQFVNFGASGTTQQLLITGLDPAKTYDLTIASAILINTNQASRGEWSTTNTTSTVGNQPVDNTLDENGSTWVRGNNYVLFEDVVPNASGNITVNGFAITGDPYDIRLPLNGFQLVESASLIAGPVSNAMSTVTATPAAVVANGVSASTVKVTLKDASGVRVANKQVTLANNGGLTPPNALTTNAQGEANFTVSSSTVGTVVFTATVVADSLTLTDTASVEFTDPEAPVAFNVNIYADAPATGLVGVVGAPSETWNQGTTSASNLIDSTGVASSVSVTGLPSDGYNVNAALKVFAANRNFFGKGTDTTIAITGLVPDTAYDLYIYSLSHNNASWGDFTDTERAAGDFVTSNTVLGNGQSQWLDNGITGVNGDSFMTNGNYVVFQSIVSNNLGNISVLADALDGPGSTRLHLSGLQIRPATGVSLDYAAWRNSQYPGLGLPDEDDDGDGLSNDYERIFGMNPTDPASSSPYRGGFDRATGSLGYTRRSQSLINMNYKVWYSTDLANWLEDNAALQTVESTSNGVEFMDVWIDPLLLSQPKLFVRVAATPITGVDTEPSLINLWGSGNSITLLFSEPMNLASASNPANYQVLQTGGGAIAITGVTLSSDGGSVTLTLASALGNNTGYTVNLEGVTSGTGQPLGTGVTRQFKTWDDDPNGIKVFILAGQSNMVGYGSVETGNGGVAGAVGSLRYLAVNDASYPDYNYASLLTNPSQPTTSPFRTRSDVKVWWRDGGPNLGGTVRKGDLGPPFKGADNSFNGPEFAFGHVMGDFYPSNNVLLVKTAWGGRSLVKDFRPPSAVAARGGRVGDFFSAIIDQTRDVLTNLATEFPEWSGQGYQIVGFGWHQGFNDLIDATASAEYKDNLPDLIKDVRTVFGKPNLPFTIVSTGQNPAVEMPPYTGYTPLEKAQLWAAGVPRPANVLSKDARPFWRTVEVSPADQGYHWNWNAETYFLIGKSLGDNMVNLLTP